MNIIEIDGKQLEILTAFENNGKNYLVYKVDGELSCSSYELTNELILSKIESDEEWAMVEAKIKELMEV